jgi:hypothetical protein
MHYAASQSLVRHLALGSLRPFEPKSIRNTLLQRFLSVANLPAIAYLRALQEAISPV